MASAPTTGVPNQANQGARSPGPPQNVQSGRVPGAPDSARQLEQARAPGARVAVTDAKEHALVPVSAQVANNAAETGAKGFGAQVARLPVELDVSIPLREFRVRDLLALEPGRLIESEWSGGVDLPLAAGAVQLAWAEFEVVETQLVVRLTRLA